MQDFLMILTVILLAVIFGTLKGIAYHVSRIADALERAYPPSEEDEKMIGESFLTLAPRQSKRRLKGKTNF